MAGKVTHEVTEEGVLIVLRPGIGAPSSLRIPHDQAVTFARQMLDDLGEGDGLGVGGRVLEIGRLRIDTANGSASIDERFVRLTPKEYQLVEALALRPGQTLSKEQLFNRLYQVGDEPELKIIDVFVCKVRNKFRAFGAEKQIETVWGRGYKLVADPNEGAWEPPLGRTRPSAIQAAILARLRSGDATFADLWALNPIYAESTIRNALLTLRHRGEVIAIGDPRHLIYRIQTAQAAA